jgi:hypothetical protein
VLSATLQAAADEDAEGGAPPAERAGATPAWLARAAASPHA